MKTKLLFVNGHLEIGGVEKSLVDILRWLDYSQYDVDLLLIEGEGTYKERIPSEVNIVFVDTTKAYGAFWSTITKCIKQKEFFALWFRFVILTAKLFGKKTLYLLTPILHLKSKYDCAIAYRPGPCADIVAYAVRANKKICWWHHGEICYNKSQTDSINITWRHFSNIVTVSNGCRLILENHFTSCAGKTIVIPNMIDVDEITTMAGSINPYSNTSSKTIIVTVGRLSPEKHIENVAYSAKQMIDSGFNNFIWYIIGDGQQRNNIQETIDTLGVESYVILLGNKCNPYPYIKFADLLVHTSYVESQCITILEAMALKTPCVAVASMGPKEYMNDSNGYIVSEDVSSIAETLFRAINDLPCKIKANNAYETVYNNYSPSLIIKKLNGLIEL
jgi:glycosyltransferase involved in cell wall biosynthesis